MENNIKSLENKRDKLDILRRYVITKQINRLEDVIKLIKNVRFNPRGSFPYYDEKDLEVLKDKLIKEISGKTNERRKPKNS